MFFRRWVWPWQTWWRRCMPTAPFWPPCCRGGRQGGDRRLTATFSLLRWELGSFRNQIYEDLLQYFKIQLCSFSFIPTLSRISLHIIFACMKHSSPFQQYFHTTPLQHHTGRCRPWPTWPATGSTQAWCPAGGGPRTPASCRTRYLWQKYLQIWWKYLLNFTFRPLAPRMGTSPSGVGMTSK